MMIEVEQEALKEILKSDFAANRRSGKYLLLYNIYSEVIDEYPAHQAAQIISMDLGLDIKDYTIRRARNAADKQRQLMQAKQTERSSFSIHEQQYRQASNTVEEVLNNYRPVGMDEKKSSNIIFHNK